ncbi:MAG: sigma-70 family RNA polymerase sigma factor [Allomuricauda sp.]
MKNFGSKEFEKLYKENYIHFLFAALTIVKDRAISEDIVQSFFETIWKKKETLTVHKNFRSYGISAVRKLSLKQVSKKEKERHVFSKLILVSNESHESTNMNESQFEKINQIIQTIPESRRNIFLDFVLGDLSYKEIAEMRNISINTVKAQMRRAYDFIRSTELDKISIIALYLSNLI